MTLYHLGNVTPRYSRVDRYTLWQYWIYSGKSERSSSFATYE